MRSPATIRACLDADGTPGVLISMLEVPALYHAPSARELGEELIRQADAAMELAARHQLVMGKVKP